MTKYRRRGGGEERKRRKWESKGSEMGIKRKGTMNRRSGGRIVWVTKRGRSKGLEEQRSGGAKHTSRKREEGLREHKSQEWEEKWPDERRSRDTQRIMEKRKQRRGWSKPLRSRGALWSRSQCTNDRESEGSGNGRTEGSEE
jgi:hypothetical protein